jgi:hypothetical protein
MSELTKAFGIVSVTLFTKIALHFSNSTCRQKNIHETKVSNKVITITTASFETESNMNTLKIKLQILINF